MSSMEAPAVHRSHALRFRPRRREAGEVARLKVMALVGPRARLPGGPGCREYPTGTLAPGLRVGQTIAFRGLSSLTKGRLVDRRQKTIVCPTSVSLQQDGHGVGGYVDAFDAVAECEGPADNGVGVHGDKEILNEEVEGAAVDDNTGDLHALDIDGGAAGGGAYAGGDTDGALAIENFGHEPAGLEACGTFQLAEIDEGGAGGKVAGGYGQPRIADSDGSFPGDPGVEFGDGEEDARTGWQTPGFDGVELLFGGGVVVMCRAGERCGGNQDRNSP